MEKEQLFAPSPVLLGVYKVLCEIRPPFLRTKKILTKEIWVNGMG